MESAIAKAIQLKYQPVALMWSDEKRRMPCSLLRASGVCAKDATSTNGINFYA
jgi:hypothetical protein